MASKSERVLKAKSNGAVHLMGARPGAAAGKREGMESKAAVAVN